MTGTETRVAERALKTEVPPTRHAAPAGVLGAEKWRRGIAAAPLSASAKRAAHALTLHTKWVDQSVTAPLATFLQDAGSRGKPLARSSWFEGLAELIEAGWVTRLVRGKPGTQAVYQLTLPVKAAATSRRPHRRTRPPSLSSGPKMGPPSRTPVSLTYVREQKTRTGTLPRPAAARPPTHPLAASTLDQLPYPLRQMEPQPRAAALRLLTMYLNAGFTPNEVTDHVHRVYDPAKPVWKPMGLLRTLLTSLPLTPAAALPPPDPTLCPHSPAQEGSLVVYARLCALCRRGMH